VSAIEVKGLEKVYGEVRALDGLDFSVERGAIFGFLGPNGAGKTTALRILAGLAHPSEGQALIEGQPVGPESPIRKMLGYLPEEPGFYPWLSAREFLVDLIGGLYGLPPQKANARGEEMLALVGLEDAADRRVGGFSRGMRQRLGLAQALIHRPRVLLLDEPVSALDPAGRHDVLALIEGLKGDTTVLMSTHILGDVDRICDNVGIIDHGRIVAIGERQELLERYALPITEVIFHASEDAVLGWGESIRNLHFVRELRVLGNVVHIRVEDVERNHLELQNMVMGTNMVLQSYRKVRPQLEDVFLSLVR
jgi:ABC-2 type transport system ATP-binding protein